MYNNQTQKKMQIIMIGLAIIMIAGMALSTVTSLFYK